MAKVAKGYQSAAVRATAAKGGKAKAKAIAPVHGDDEVPPKQIDQDGPKGSDPVQLSSENEDYMLCKASAARSEAQSLANVEGKTIYARDPVTDSVLFSANPAPDRKPSKAPKKTAAKPSATAKVAKAAAPAKAAPPIKAGRVAKDKPEPGSFAERIIAMCCRKQGATPAELNDLTKWKGAPWKWTLSNPKNNGLADRYGYTLSVNTDKGRSTYFLVAKA